MSAPPRRRRRITLEVPVGIGGLSPHPAPGPVTALRVLGRNVEISLEPAHAERLETMPGAYTTFHGMRVLALDGQTHELIPALVAYAGPDAPKAIDSVLAACFDRRPIVLHARHCAQVIDLARTIHQHTTRKDFPFLPVQTIPRTAAEIERVCTDAGCGTVFLDLTKRRRIPVPFLEHLLGDHFHLWVIVAAQAVDDVRRSLGSAARFLPLCRLGFGEVTRQDSNTLT